MAGEVKEKAKKSKKLSKVIEGNVITITEKVTGKVLKFDAATLPKEIQAKLMPYGLSQKLGDAAAGKEGQEAVESISKVWDGLVKNDWTTRAPAKEKINKSELVDRFNNLPAAQKAVLAKDEGTKKMLEALGVKF